MYLYMTSDFILTISVFPLPQECAFGTEFQALIRSLLITMCDNPDCVATMNIVQRREACPNLNFNWP